MSEESAVEGDEIVFRKHTPAWHSNCKPLMIIITHKNEFVQWLLLNLSSHFAVLNQLVKKIDNRVERRSKKGGPQFKGYRRVVGCLSTSSPPKDCPKWATTLKDNASSSGKIYNIMELFCYQWLLIIFTGLSVSDHDSSAVHSEGTPNCSAETQAFTRKSLFPYQPGEDLFDQNDTSQLKWFVFRR